MSNIEVDASWFMDMDMTVREALRAGAEQLLCAERADAIIQAVRLKTIYHMVTMAVETKAFVNLPGGSEVQLTALAFRSVRAEIATTLHRSERGVGRMIADSLALHEHLPAAAAALAEGKISFWHARIIIDHAAPLSSTPEAVAIFDAELTQKALTMPASSLGRVARKLCERLHPHELSERFRKASTERRAYVENDDDGMAWLHLYLPVVEAHMIMDRANTIAEAQHRAEKDAAKVGAASVDTAGIDTAGIDTVSLETDAGTEPEVEAGLEAVAVACPELTARTIGQIRVDVMRDLLLENCPANLPIPSSGGVKSTVRITIPALSLLGQSNEPATLDGYGPIDMETARRIASVVPSFQRVLTDPFDSTVLDVEQCSYTPSAALKRWVMLRDQSCRFPGCNQPAWRGEIDHTVAWENDGPTAYDNLACLCRNHHHLKHEGGWALTQQPQGVLRWVSPLGRIHYTHPATQIQVPAPVKPVPPPRPRNPHDVFNTPILTAPDDPPPF